MAGTAPTSTDCILYYKLENNADDETDNYDSTINGATYSSSGKVGGAYGFDGINDYISTVKTWSAETEFSISFWFKPDSYPPSSNQYILSSTNGGATDIGVSYRTDSTCGASLRTDTGSVHTYTAAIGNSNWHHFVWTWKKNGQHKVYLDGGTPTTNTAYDEFNSYIALYLGGLNERGSMQSNTGFDGMIDEVAFFDVELTSNNVTYLYNGGSPTSAQQYPFSGGSAGWGGKLKNVSYDDIAKLKNTTKSSIAKFKNIEITSEGDGPFNNHTTLGTDCEAYYKLDGDAKDSTPNGNDGTVEGATIDSTGKIGSCYDFDGTNDYIHIPNIQDTSSAFSWSWWVQKGSNSTQGIIGVSDANALYVYWSGTGKLRLIRNSSVIIDYTTTTNLDTWYHIILTHDGAGNYELFLNDSSIGSASSTTFNSINDFWISRFDSGGAYYLDGKIDEVGIWSKELTSAEITALYNSGDGLTY